MIDVEVSSDDLVDAIRALRGMEDGKEIRKAMRRNIASAAKPMVPAIRAKVKSLPSKGLKGSRQRQAQPGLRASVARAVRLQVQMSGRFAGVTVRVDPKKMPPGMRNLPGYLEGTAPFQRWRHPVFGDADRYVSQQPRPYFYAIADRYEEPVRRAVADVVDTIQNQINS